MPGWPRAAPTATGARVDDVRAREELPVMIGIMPSPRPVTRSMLLNRGVATRDGARATRRQLS